MEIVEWSRIIFSWPQAIDCGDRPVSAARDVWRIAPAGNVLKRFLNKNYVKQYITDIFKFQDFKTRVLLKNFHNSGLQDVDFKMQAVTFKFKFFKISSFIHFFEFCFSKFLFSKLRKPKIFVRIILFFQKCYFQNSGF